MQCIPERKRILSFRLNPRDVMVVTSKSEIFLLICDFVHYSQRVKYLRYVTHETVATMTEEMWRGLNQARSQGKILSGARLSGAAFFRSVGAPTKNNRGRMKA